MKKSRNFVKYRDNNFFQLLPVTFIIPFLISIISKISENNNRNFFLIIVKI